MREATQQRAPRSSLVLAACSLAWLLGCRGAEPSPAPSLEAPIAAPVGEHDEAQPAERPAISDDPVIEALVDLAALDSQVDDHLAMLVDEIGPRLTATPQLLEAELWAVDQLEGWGLTVTREQWGEFPVRFERGRATGEVVRPSRRELEIGTHAWTPGTRGQEGLEAGGPVRGQAVRHPSDAASLRAAKPYLRGAWIMVPHDFVRPTGALAQQIERAFDHAPIAGLVYAAGGPEDTRIHTWGRWELDPDELPTRVEIRLRGDQHHELIEQLGAGAYVELEFAVANRLSPGPVPVHNVIAELPGIELPGQRIVVGGHLDSWDGARGAVDNATGVATTMEAARLLAAACARVGRGPKRTLSFQLWTGEEQGLLGSKAWVAAHAELLPEISAVLVHDHGTNFLSGFPVTPEQYATMSALIEPVTKLAPETMPFDIRLVEGLPFESSDSSSFLRAGVPAYFWDQSGRSDYDRYHHTQYDLADAVIDEYQRHSALVVAIVAWRLAELPQQVERDNLAALPPRRLGVGLDQTTVERVTDGVGKRGGLRVGDRIVEIDAAAVGNADELGAALQRGEGHKQVVVERDGARVELSLDWSEDEDEPARIARRAQRRERFDIQLRPWDREVTNGQ